jgi:homoserine kinase
MTGWQTVRAPASSANLGPGFDALALALGLYLECGFRPAERLQIQVSGRDAAQIPADESNLIWRTVEEAARRNGSVAPPLEIKIRNEIPIGKGLGSSAAAIVAALAIADRVLGLGWSRERILDQAAWLEGHPDNVAACVLGSVVASAIGADGHARVVRLEMPAGIRIAAVVPNYPLATSAMRAVLPGSYTSGDAIFNVQRASLLVAALATGDRSAFPMALEDRMHQPYRAGIMPGLQEVLTLRAPGLLGCTLSGAGPSVLVFFEAGAEACTEQVREILSHDGLCPEVLLLSVEPRGYEIT